MARVDTFPQIASVHSDTAIAGQIPGNGAAAAPFNVTMSQILAWIQSQGLASNIPTEVSGVGSLSTPIPAGTLLEKIVVHTSDFAGTLEIGTSATGSEIIETEDYQTATVFVVNQYFPSAGTLYVHGYVGKITVKIYSR